VRNPLLLERAEAERVLTDSTLAVGMVAAALLGERALGLSSPLRGSPPLQVCLNGFSVGLLAGALAHAACAGIGIAIEGASSIVQSVVVAPIAEERLFRGLLARALGPVMSSVLFAVVHARGLGQTVALTVIGLVLVRVFLRHGLIASVGLHAGLNASLSPP
jgi:membrane protease YdiL (CAAX protease family)